jgi:hypothetical protein
MNLPDLREASATLRHGPSTGSVPAQGERAALRRATGAVLECLLVLAVVALLLEGMSRIVHLNKRPAIPAISDPDGALRMPAGFDATIQLAGRAPFALCTDGQGLRVADCSAATLAADPEVLVVGDSQALGWGFDFGQTFGALVAAELPGHRSGSARLMAAAATDVESLRSWAADYRRDGASVQARAKSPAGQLPLLNIVSLNLGNDLDEMFFSRSSVTVPRFRAAREWLAVHSTVMADFTIAKNALFNAEWQSPPGANPVLFALDDAERATLAKAAAAAVERLAQALPPARDTVVLLLPNDYQVQPGEFDKYRRFYPQPAQFESWQRRIPQAVARLDALQSAIAAELQAHGVRVAVPHEALKAADPLALFDRGSHHYSPLGQRILARSILEALHAGNGKLS